MCGRFTQLFSWSQVWSLSQPFWLPIPAPEGSPARANIAPTQRVALLDARPPHLREMRWGLPNPRGGILINARRETAATLPTFRDAAARRRCLVPMSGFYEWERLDAKTKQPWYLTALDHAPLLLAALWSDTPEGPAFAVLTAEATHPATTRVHHRVPCIVRPEDAPAWLDPHRTDALDAALGFGDPAAPAIDAWRVSPRVNTPHTDEPSLVAPADPVTPDQPGLFG